MGYIQLKCWDHDPEESRLKISASFQVAFSKNENSGGSKVIQIWVFRLGVYPVPQSLSP
jgi:hypothetical protein